jgi:chitinase
MIKAGMALLTAVAVLSGAACDGSGDARPPTTTTNASEPSNQVNATTSYTPNPPPPGGYANVAYFTQWGSHSRDFTLSDVEASGAAAKLTHINYAFGNVDSEGRCFESNEGEAGNAWADYQRRFAADESVDGVADVFDQPLAGNFNQLRKLKQRHPDLKVLMSLGGWAWSKYFSNAAVTAASRQAFAASCVDLFIRGNLPIFGGEPQGGPGSAAGVFDGIDIDWEWPGSEGNSGNVIRGEDKQNFTLLLAELRRQLDAFGSTLGRQFQLTAFLPADPTKIAAGVEVDRAFSYLDFATVQGYDFHGPWENRTNHHSQLRSPPADPTPGRLSVETAINAYLGAGAPARKLVVGVPAYGKGWRGVPSTDRGLYQPSAGPAPGTWEAGTEDYKVLVKLPGTRFRDTTSGAVWLHDGNQWWSYDDPRLLIQKVAWIRSNGLGGAMMWSLDGDTNRATLTTALHDAFAR